MVRKTKITETNTIDETPADQIELLEGEDVDRVPWDQEFRDWESSVNQSHQRTTFVLYRLDPEGQLPATHAWRWLDKIPTDHECGLTVGGGKFRALLTIEKGDNQPRYVRNKIFYIDPVYDDYRTAQKMEQEIRHQGRHQGGASRAEVLAELKEMAEFFRGVSGQAPQSPWASLPGLQDELGRVAKLLVRNTLAPPPGAVQVAPGAPPPPTGDEPITSKDLLELAAKYGPQIIEALGLKDRFKNVVTATNAAAEAA